MIEIIINCHLYKNYMATFDDFQKLAIRVGKIISIDDFPEAKKPAYKLKIDFGKEIGVKKSTAQLVKNYKKEDLQDKLILCVVNFPPRQVGPTISEVLVLGVPDKDGRCVLIRPEIDVPIGGRLY
jgi:tRNA-binding protein